MGLTSRVCRIAFPPLYPMSILLRMNKRQNPGDLLKYLEPPSLRNLKKNPDGIISFVRDSELLGQLKEGNSRNVKKLMNGLLGMSIDRYPDRRGLTGGPRY